MMTETMLRPSEFRIDGTMTFHGELVVGRQYVRGGVLITTKHPGGTLRSSHLNGRRTYPVVITPKENQ